MFNPKVGWAHFGMLPMVDIEAPSELVNRLHGLRISRGLTIQQMAEKCVIPKSSLESCMKLSGAKRPGVDVLTAIADAMGVSIDWLVGRAVDSFPPKLNQREYAPACFAAVSGLINWIREKQSDSPASAVHKEDIARISDAELAANTMLAFVERLSLFKDTAHAAGDDRRGFVHRLLDRVQTDHVERDNREQLGPK